MADKALSGLPSATLPLGNSDEVYVVQNGNSKAATVEDLSIAVPTLHKMNFDTQYALTSTTFTQIGTTLPLVGLKSTNKVLISVSLWASHRNFYSGYVKLLANAENLFTSGLSTTRNDSFMNIRSDGAVSGNATTYAPEPYCYSNVFEPSADGDYDLKLEASTGIASQPLWINRSSESANHANSSRVISALTAIVFK